MKATGNPGNSGEKSTGTDGRSFEIITLQQLAEKDGCFLSGPRRSRHFEIVWINRGSGIHCIDLEEHAVENDNLLFVKPGQVHHLRLNEPFDGYAISFSETFLCMEEQETNSAYHSTLFKMFASAKAISIGSDVLPDMTAIAERMKKEFDSHNLFRAEILRRYFKIFLIYITRQLEGSFSTTRQTRNIELAQRFMALVERNYKEQKMVSDYAAMLSVTPNYLNEIVKKTTGFSAGHHIRQRIALEAKRQAAYSGNCMKEIAYFLGFGDMAHFSKFFKNTTGINFSDFKKERLVISPVSSF
jgi:YesN/AraC family two-component response regulator